MRGIFRKAHFVALISMVILCLVVATAATPAQNTASKTNSVKVTVADCTPAKYAFVAKCFAVTTSPASAVVVNTGTDKRYTIGTPDRRRVKHTVWVRGLSPNTPYYAQVVAKNKSGKTLKSVWSTFKTAAPGSAPMSVTNKGNKLLWNGSPSTMIMSRTIDNCPTTQLVGMLDEMDVDVLATDNSAVVSSCDGTQTDSHTWAMDLHGSLQDRMWWRTQNTSQFQALNSQSLSELLDWRASTSTAYSGPPANFPSGDTGFLALGCKSLATLASNLEKNFSRPILYNVSISENPIKQGLSTCVSTNSMAAEFWLVARKRGNIEWVLTNYHREVATLLPNAENEATTLAKEKATLGPVLTNGSAVPAKATGTASVTALKYSGDVYLFIVNPNPNSESVKITMPTGSHSAQPMWGGKTVFVPSGTLSVTLPGFGYRIYRVR